MQETLGTWCAGVVDRLDRLIGDGKNPFMLPGVQIRQSGPDENHHADIETLNRALSVMPGVNFGPHGARYGFSTYGERDLGFAKSEAKLVLDHMEGTDAKDVAGQFYSSDPAIARKREMLLLWTAWLDKQAALAIEADPLLLDRDHLSEAIYRKKHGKQADEKLAKRIQFREGRGWPLWGPNEKQDAAE